MSKDKIGRMLLEASAGVYGEEAKTLADAWCDMARENEELKLRIVQLEKDAANARKAAIEDCAELLARQHAWLTNVAAATLVLNMDTAKQGA